MDLLIETARTSGADLAIANDPDADRLAVAIPQPDGSWRRLGGDEIGWLFADYLLEHGDGDDRLVVTTLVSSALLSKMAAVHGVQSVETFTGFKWIAREVLDRPALRFVLGYEQALGYLVAERPLDKDGISAAVLFAEMAGAAAADGRTMQQWLDDIAARFGRHVLADASVRMSPDAAAAKVAALRADPPASIGGRDVVKTAEYPEANLLRFELDGGVRVQIRPSGTEPKVKLYGEAVDEDPAPFVDALAALLS
jgi:phosphomannomutase